jgi:multidrug efflux pump subunit AcrA (membrane-fusion protein)
MSLEKPRFRRDLAAVPVEADGERYVEVCDPNTGGTFLFYDFEYRVALAFDGLDLDRVIPWVKLSTGMELRVDQLQAFAASLEGMGFLEGDATHAPAVAALVEAPGTLAPAEVDATKTSPSPPQAESASPQVWSSPPPAAPIRDVEEPRPDSVEPRAEVVAVAAVAATLGEDGVATQADLPTNVAPDATAFPVMPGSASQTPAPETAPAPFQWTTPGPLMTPSPVTFGPILEHPSSRRRLRRSLVLFGSLGVLAAAAVLALALPFLFSSQEPQRPRVRTLVVAPGTIFRYFDSAGVVQLVPSVTLKFPARGKVTRMASVGSPVAVGDIAAAVDAARPLQAQLTHQRERLAFYQQMAEAMHQVGNAQEEERQVAKVELRNARIAKTLRALADVAVVADAPGDVAETFAHEGDTVEAGQPALRLRSAGVRATFELSRQQAAQARRLGFCQIEVEGYGFDCTQLQEKADETHASVEVSSIPASLLGKAAHLARARFSGAFEIPLAAIVRPGSRDEVFVVSPQSRAEARSVAVLERDASFAIVVQGLDAGDRVVAEVAPGLRPGAQVALAP